MVPLPDNVRAITKANGRRFFGWQRFRGTPREWPRVPLPADPLSEEFARRSNLCERLTAAEPGNRHSAWVFTDAAGRAHEIPPIDRKSDKLAIAFWKAIERADEVGKRVAAGDKKTFSALIYAFKGHIAYKEKISDSTRDQYDRWLTVIEDAWGDDPVANLDPENAQKAIDALSDTPAAARVFRATISRLIGWGVPRGYRSDNPILLTEKIDGGGTYSPWPPEAFEIWFEHARADLHVPVYSGLFTGQRKVDVLKMLRPEPDATEMPIVAQKTSSTVPIQIHSEYRQIIAASAPAEPEDVVPMRKEPKPLHCRTDGVPWTYEGMKTAWQREIENPKKPALAVFAEKRWVFHGLRKNAVNMLLEIGCSEAMVGAIVGMSEAMVRHYSREVSKFRLARGAMKILEDNWTAQRAHVLGKVKKIGG